jgi:type II secretory pathway component GspD/PulD (secretin)
MLGGSMLGGWVGRGMVEEVKQRLVVVETDQRKCQESIKEDIKSIVQQAIDRQSLTHVEQLGAIRTELAVISALHGETQADVKALFERFERRKNEVVLPPTGERRDQV